MSTRTIIEINHDFLNDLIINPRIFQGFLSALMSCREDAERNLGWGLKILNQRHHSEKIFLEVE